MRLRALLAALVALTIGAVMVSPAVAKTTSPLEAVRTLMAARAKAEREHDRAAYLATIDPEASATFRDAQLASFDGLSSLPVHSLTYDVRTDLVGDLTRAVDPKKYGGAPVYLPQTVRTLEFDLDAAGPGLDDMWWTYVLRHGRWYVGGNDDVGDLGLLPSQQMWDLGPVVIARGPHVLLLAHPGNQERAQSLVNTTESALATLAQRWTLPWAGHLVGFLPNSPDELATIIQATVDVTKFVAFVSYAFDPDSLKPTAPRLYVQDKNLSVYGAAQQTETLVHEFTHAAGAGYTSPFTPAWVQEGTADWVAGGETKPAAPTPQLGATPPRNDQFGAGTQTQIIRAYQDSRSLIAELATLKGAAAPFDFFKRLGSEPVRAGNSDYVVDQSLGAFGLTADGLVAALRR